jgi:predicted lactoylglutathione lyase
MSTGRMIFVNLAIDDLPRTIAFWTELGFEFNPQFTDENGTCMIINDQAYAMLLTKSRFKDFTTKTIPDSRETTEVIVALSAESRDDVDSLVDNALANGASPANEAMDMGMMYGRSFQDLDGHIWEVVWMDPAAIQG